MKTHGGLPRAKSGLVPPLCLPNEHMKPRLVEHFSSEDHIVLPGLIDPAIAREVVQQIEVGEFVPKEDDFGVRNSLPSTHPVTNRLNFLLNDPDLFRLIEEITACSRIGCFAGRLFRSVEGDSAPPSWHDDLGDNHLVAMSINLSPETYSGGLLEMRDRGRKQILRRIANRGFGDALVFRLAENLQHQVTPVEGDRPRITFVGWFSSQPDFFAWRSRKLS